MLEIVSRQIRVKKRTNRDHICRATNVVVEATGFVHMVSNILINVFMHFIKVYCMYVCVLHESRGLVLRSE